MADDPKDGVNSTDDVPVNEPEAPAQPEPTSDEE